MGILRPWKELQAEFLQHATEHAALSAVWRWIYLERVFHQAIADSFAEGINPYDILRRQYKHPEESKRPPAPIGRWVLEGGSPASRDLFRVITARAAANLPNSSGMEPWQLWLDCMRAEGYAPEMPALDKSGRNLGAYPRGFEDRHIEQVFKASADFCLVRSLAEAALPEVVKLGTIEAADPARSTPIPLRDLNRDDGVRTLIDVAANHLITLPGFHDVDWKMREITEPLLREMENAPFPRRQAITLFDAHAGSYLTLVKDQQAWNAYRNLLHDLWYPMAYEHLFGSTHLIPLASEGVALASELHARVRHWHRKASEVLASPKFTEAVSECRSYPDDGAFIATYKENSARSEELLEKRKRTNAAPKWPVLYQDLERTIVGVWQVRPDDVTVNHVRHALDVLARLSDDGHVELDQMSCEAYGIDYSRLMILMNASPVPVNDMSAGGKVPRIPTQGATEQTNGDNRNLEMPSKAVAAKLSRALMVAKLIKELNALKPQMLEDDAEYQRLRSQYPDFLTFKIADGRPDLKMKVLAIRSSARHFRLAQELAAAHYGRQLATIQDDWKHHKPPDFRRQP